MNREWAKWNGRDNWCIFDKYANVEPGNIAV